MLNLIRIDSPKVLSIPIKNNNEGLIDLLKTYPNLHIDQNRQYAQKISKSISCLRKNVAEKLFKAQRNLRDGIVFKIIECYRPISVQKIIFDEYLNDLKTKNPDWSDKELKGKAAEFVAPPEINPPHSTGGVIDLTLMDKNGKELDMGTTLNDPYSKNCYTQSSGISEQAKKNRELLINALEKEGFVNYPYEWWHWSYGDRYWAFIKKKPFAIYGSVLE